MAEIRDFIKEEVNEINQYIVNNVPFSVLQQLFPLTDNAENKAKVFVGIWRILNSSLNYVSKEETKNKLKELLDETKEVYDIILQGLINYENSELYYQKHKAMMKFLNPLLNYDVNVKINKLVDAFLVFGEKQVMLNIDKFTGIDLDKDAGQQIYKDLGFSPS